MEKDKLDIHIREKMNGDIRVDFRNSEGNIIEIHEYSPAARRMFLNHLIKRLMGAEYRVRKVLEL